MHQYELMVIFDPEMDERTVPDAVDKFLTVITKDGGSIDNVDIWGRRRLAYEIQHKSEGIYVVINATATGTAVQEVDRQLRLSEQVIRTKVLRAEEVIAMIADEKERSEKRAQRRARVPAGKE